MVCLLVNTLIGFAVAIGLIVAFVLVVGHGGTTPPNCTGPFVCDAVLDPSAVTWLATR